MDYIDYIAGKKGGSHFEGFFFRIHGLKMYDTLPETNSQCRKMDGWKTKNDPFFWWISAYFQGKLAVLGVWSS